MQTDVNPYYCLYFPRPFKLGITRLSGVFEGDLFWLYQDNKRYSDLEDLKNTIKVVGGEIFR